MSDIERLHEVDLNIVKSVIKVLDKNKLKYYMIGGTMLGAIRHKGFIPWDDDIDLGIPRDDYEKFLTIAQNELPSYLKLVNYRNKLDYQYYITRILDINVNVVESRIGNNAKYTNASIDIFPIDGTPNNHIIRKIYFFRVLYHRALMSLCYKDSIDRKRKRGFFEKILLFIMEKVNVEKFTTPYKQKCKIDKLLRSQDIRKSHYIGNIMGAYRTKEIVPKEYYGEGKMYQFEDIMLNGVEMYDEYLTYTYGDYMKLPPKDKQKIHFEAIQFVNEKITE